MDLTAQINAYCERVDVSYWSEPLNAVSNAAFLVAAFVMWRRTRGLGLPLATLLVIALTMIGITSYLWHTHALAWTGAADSLSILVFILIYLYAANRHFLDLPAWGAWLLTVSFLPYAAALGWVFDQLPYFTISSFYWPLVPLMLGYGWVLRVKAPGTARGLVLSAGLLTLSLTARSVDEPLCPTLPIGTHYLWHILNGLLLGWVIEVYRRHMLAGRAAQG